MAKNALITGATGLVGTHLLQQLITNHHYQKIYSLQRRSTDSSHVKVEEIVANLEELDSVDLPDIHAAFCCLGTTMKQAGSKEKFRKVDFEMVINTARKAKENKANVFCVISAMGANSDSSIFYNKVKGEMEEALEEFDFDTLHIFRPSILVGDRKEFRLSENLGIFFAKLLDPIMKGPLQKYRASSAQKVAHLMEEKSLIPECGQFIWEAEHFTLR